MAIAVAVQWLANFTIIILPYMMEVSGAMTYGFYGPVCTVRTVHLEVPA